MRRRYDIRPDSIGWTVFDIWTGEPAVIALLQQTRLNLQDALELTRLLNEQVAKGSRIVLQ